jgi:hypothetical protein
MKIEHVSDYVTTTEILTCYEITITADLILVQETVSAGGTR